ncbi:MAG: CHAD domain-containing protein [Planctomycetota bacterium]
MAVTDTRSSPARDPLAETAGAWLREAESLLRERGVDDPDAVHRVRQMITRARSALRLIREAIDRAEFDELDPDLRAAAHALSGRRDRQVATETLDRLARGASRKSERRAIRAAARAIGGVNETVRPVGATAAELADRLAAIAPRVRAQIEGCSSKTVRRGLRRSFRTARRARRLARREPTVGRLHDWRRRTRHLRNQVRWLAPDRSRGTRRRIHGLSELLGELNDLAVLESLLDESKDIDRDQRRSVARAIEAERRELLGASSAISERVFGARAKRFSRRFLPS